MKNAWQLKSVHCFTSVVAALWLGTAGCKKSTTPSSQNSLAQVNGKPITEETFRHWWKKSVPAEDTSAARRAVLDKLVNRALQVDNALAEGLDRDPLVVESMESFLIARLNEIHLEPALASLEVTEDELKVRYEEGLLKEESPYHLPAKARVSVLWYDSRGQAPLQQRYRMRLEQARTRAIQGLDPGAAHALSFGELSLSHSEHRPSRYKGGEIGWVELGPSHSDPWRNTVASVASGLENPGDISPVIISPQGVFLVRLMELSPARVLEFTEVRERLRRQLLQEKQSTLRADFADAATRGGVVQIEEDKLAAMKDLPVRSDQPSNSAVNTAFFKP